MHAQEMHGSLPPHPARDLKSPAAPSHMKGRLCLVTQQILRVCLAARLGGERGTRVMYANMGL